MRWQVAFLSTRFRRYHSADRPDDGKQMYLGIDFSGGADPWKARCSRPTVWVAAIENIVAPRLTNLRPVQSLPGDGEPFTRLLALLRAGDFAAAGIDAPFAISARVSATGRTCRTPRPRRQTIPNAGSSIRFGCSAR